MIKLFDFLIDWITIKLLNFVFKEDHSHLLEEPEEVEKKNNDTYIWDF